MEQLNLCVETIHTFKGINVPVSERMHQFIMRGGRGGTSRAAQSVRGNYTYFKGINVTVSERMHQFIMVQYVVEISACVLLDKPKIPP